MTQPGLVINNLALLLAESQAGSFPIPRVINFNFSLEPHEKYYTTQYKDRGFS